MRPVTFASIVLTAVVLFGSVLDSESFGIRRSGLVFVVCQKFVVDDGCNKCSDYFSALSEEEAESKCEKMGYDEAFYFPRVGAAFRWMIGNCDCASDGK